MQSNAAVIRSRYPELKYLDVPTFAAGLNTVPTFTALNLIRAGSSAYNRQGRKVELKSIQIRAEVQLAGPANNSGTYLRVLVVYDRQPPVGGAVPALSEILQDVDQAGAVNTTVFSGPNLDNRDRFRILHDRRTALPAVLAGGGGIQPAVSVDMKQDIFLKTPNIVTQFRAESSPAVVADIAAGVVWLITLSDTLAASNPYNMAVAARVRFGDL